MPVDENVMMRENRAGPQSAGKPRKAQRPITKGCDMADFNTIDDLDLDGKVVLVRVDLNVPVENGQVTDATRIEKIVPTVREAPSKARRRERDLIVVVVTR